jgi:hypothetical protein
MTPAAFRARAAKGDMEIIEMLGAETFRNVYESRDSFYAEFPCAKIVADTRERQWTRAQRGAAEQILFCGDEVLLDAGEPVHYFGSYADFVGPAFSNRHIKLPSRGDNPEWSLERIEILVERHRIDGAALACARALVRHLVWKAMLPSVHGAGLRQRFDGYFSDLDDRDMIDVELCRRMLSAALSPIPREERKDLTWEIEVASDVLKRLDELSPPNLDEVDDEALAALGFQ